VQFSFARAYGRSRGGRRNWREKPALTMTPRPQHDPAAAAQGRSWNEQALRATDFDLHQVRCPVIDLRVVVRDLPDAAPPSPTTAAAAAVAAATVTFNE